MNLFWYYFMYDVRRASVRRPSHNYTTTVAHLYHGRGTSNAHKYIQQQNFDYEGNNISSYSSFIVLSYSSII